MNARDSLQDPDELALMERARKGDKEALDRIISLHQGVVYRFLLGFLRDEDLAADAAQETFLKALDRLDGFRGDASFRTWLLAIAKNEALGLIRSRGRRREEAIEQADTLPDRSDAPDVLAVQSDEMRRVRTALDRLPEKQRLCVSLRLFDGLSFREIGSLTESSEGAARVNYHYGLGRLREWLNNDDI